MRQNVSAKNHVSKINQNTVFVSLCAMACNNWVDYFKKGHGCFELNLFFFVALLTVYLPFEGSGQFLKGAV